MTSPRKWALESLTGAGGFLLGRRTYEILASYWPNAPRGGAGARRPLNTKPKYVASATLAEPLGWQISTVLEGDLADAVAALRQEDGADLHMIGSPHLVQARTEHDLVDEFRVMIDPLVLGGGLANYAPAEP